MRRDYLNTQEVFKSITVKPSFASLSPKCDFMTGRGVKRSSRMNLYIYLNLHALLIHNCLSHSDVLLQTNQFERFKLKLFRSKNTFLYIGSEVCWNSVLL